MKDNWITKVLEAISDTFAGGERAWLDLLGALVPYGVTLIPAYLTYFHTYKIMEFPQWVAAVAAFVVEVFGVTSMHTIVKFWENNKKYTSDKSEMRAPLNLAIFTYAFYMVIVLVVNVVLETVSKQRSAWVIVAIALFSLMGIPAGILVAIRATHREKLEARQQARTQKNEGQGKPTHAQGERRPKHASDYRDKIIEMAQAHHAKTGEVITPKAVTTALKLEHDKAKGYVSTTLTTWAKENGIEKNHPFTFHKD